MAEMTYPKFSIYLSESPSIDRSRGRCILVKFQYHEGLISVIKGIPGSQWRSVEKCWEIRYPMVRVFLQQVKRHIALLQITPQYFISESLNNSVQKYDLSTMKYKSTPFPYQYEGIDYLLRNKKCILGDEPGCGKTLQLLYAAQYLKEHEGLKHCLIICGINGNKYNWEAEVKKHTPYNAHVLGTHRNKKTGKPIEEGTAGLVKDLRNIPNATFWIMNVEKLRQGHVPRKRGQRKTINEFPIVAMIQELIDKGEIGMVAFDEFHKCIKGDSVLQVKLGSTRSTVEYRTIEEVYDLWSKGVTIYVKSISKKGYYTYQHIDKVHRNMPSEPFYRLVYGFNYSDLKYEIIASESHRIYMPDTKEFVEVKDLKVMDYVGLSSAKHLRGRLYQKEQIRFTETYCYDLDVSKTHCYFANNLLIHNCKQPTSLQSQALLWLQCPREVAMTGTLIVNTPTDMYMPFKWLGLEHRDYWTFENRYTIKDMWGSVIGYQNAQELINVLGSYQLRRLKKNVLPQLPPKIYINDYVELSKEEWRVYDAIQWSILSILNGTSDNSKSELKRSVFDSLAMSNPLAMSVRLRQATASSELLSDIIKKSTKLDRMEELVEEIISRGEKVVVFSNWTQVTNLAKARLDKYAPAYITGEVKQADRPAEMQRFQEDETCKIMIGTIPALGTGFTLTASSNVIFLDEPWTKALKTQAEDRCSRIGSEKSTNIYTLLAKGTVDETVHQIVESKGDISDFIVDGVVAAHKKEDFLRMLLAAPREDI